jgi:putative DNA primase/helicase
LYEKGHAASGHSGNTSVGAVADIEAQSEQLEDRAETLVAGAERLESRTGCFAAIELAQAEPLLRVRLAEVDAHPHWLNTPNGTLDLLTGEFREHRFRDYLTKVTGAAYDPIATCPRWERFLEEVLPDLEVRAFMQRSFGYALTDLMHEQCIWFLHGLGRNGKTTMLNAQRKVLGEYAASTQASTIMVKKHGDDRRNDLAVLRGARFVSITEAEHGQQVAESLLNRSRVKIR